MTHAVAAGPTKQPSLPTRIKPETLTEIAVNNGQSNAMMVREMDPNGAIVVHPIKKSAYVHERLHDHGKIDDDAYDAAERFRQDFERASLGGRYTTIDLFRSSGGNPATMSDNVAAARERIRAVLRRLGTDAGKSRLQSCVWFVVGCGETLEQWSRRMRFSGDSISEAHASGILLGALEIMVLAYGISTPQRMKQRSSELAEKRGARELYSRIVGLLSLSAVGQDREALLRFDKTLKEFAAKQKLSLASGE